MIPVVLPLIMESYGLTRTSAGALAATIFIGYAGGSIAATRVASSVGTRVTILLGLTLTIASVLLFTWTWHYLTATLALFLMGLGCGVYLPNGLAIISDVTHEQRRGVVFAIHETAAPFGQVLGPLFISLALSWTDWVGCLRFWILPSLLALVLFAATVTREPVSDRTATPETHKKAVGSWTPTTTILLATTFTAITTCNLGLISMLPVYVTQRFLLDASFAALIIGTSRLTGVVSQLIGGHLSDVAGRDKVSLSIVALVAIATIGVTTLPYGAPFLAVLLLYSTSNTAFYPIILAQIADHLRGEERKRITGTIVSLAFLGASATPFLIGYLADLYGFQIAFLYPTSVGVIGLMSMYMLNRSLRPTTSG